MEEVLELCAEPYQPEYPIICKEQILSQSAFRLPRPTPTSGLLEANNTKAQSDIMSTSFYDILLVGVRLGAYEQLQGQGVTIAFLDFGFAAHPDLAGRIKLYVDASTSDIRELEKVEESGILSWHGMMTSVMACGDGIVDGYYKGMASAAQLVLIRVSDTKGRIREQGIERGLRWLRLNAQRYNIKIVNISLGGDKRRDTPKNPVDGLVDSLTAQGILVVCASGNSGQPWLLPPASAESALTVGGLDDKNTLDRTMSELWHSNYGQTQLGVWKPEVVAPSIWLAAPVLPESGVAQEAAILQKLLSTSPEELPALLATMEPLPYTKLPPDIAMLPVAAAFEVLRQAWLGQKLITPHYQHVDGTSFAAPIVSSVAAQMLEANPGLRPAGLKDLIMRTAHYLPNISPDQQGHGVINPKGAVEAALATTTQTYTQPQSV